MILFLILSQTFPKPYGFANDYANVLNSSQRNELEEYLRNIEEKSSVEIAVAIFDSIGYPIEEYANLLFEKWGIGKKGKDNGILILVSIKERLIRIEVGYGLEGIITDGIAGANEVERKAVIDAGIGAGAREVFLVPEPIASAIGIGLDISKPKGHMVVDIGGGTSEIAIISLNQIAHQNSIKIAGDEMDESIIEYIRRKYNTNIGYLTAEEIKVKIGNAYPSENEEYVEISGWDMIQHRPKTIKISSSEVREALNSPINQIISAISRLLENAKADLVRDVLENGIYLTGGGSLIRGLDLRIQEELNIKVHRVDYPLETVVRGIGKIVDNLNKFKPLLSKGRKILKSK